MKRVFLSALIMLSALTAFAGGARGRAAGAAPVDPRRPYAGTRLKWAISQSGSQGVETIAIIRMVQEETGIIIEPQIYPENVDGQIDKILVGLMAGDELDIVYNSTPNMKPMYNAGVLTPIEDLAAKAGYDIRKIYGDYLPVFGGKTYGLPAFTDIWLTLYNKKVFDDAGVPYPSAEGWTWEKYIETAKKLTNPAKKVYGSLMLDYNIYNYMYAIQSGASHYNAGGTATNYGQPIFRKSLEFFYGLGNTDKIQPSILEFKSSNIPWDSFGSQQAEYGMFVCGGWTTALMTDRARYNRQWKFGILPMPYPAGQKPSTLTVPGCYSIPATSKHKEAALAAIALIAEKQYTLGSGRVPARRDLSEQELNRYIETELVAPFVSDGVTIADFKAAWFDPNRIAYAEQPIGPADAEIKQIWVEEGQLYGQGAKTLDAAIQAIRTRSDRAIRDSGE
ncbi:MAG: extracellular solute-binding protein [Treponema sp.]|jgi:multiple sugar transport system substrate-binding protein|nr:extracellular solute-binding protein [Treponema sp.]